MSRIRLSNTGNYVKVDSFIYEILNRISWWEHHSGYAITKINNKHVPMHRLILFATENECVDHINRDRKDNRLTNLRLCNRSFNSYNVSIAKNNTTGFKGVHFHKKNKKYVAYIGKKPREYLGSFETSIEAAYAYNLAAKERFGEYAALNNLEGLY